MSCVVAASPSCLRLPLSGLWPTVSVPLLFVVEGRPLRKDEKEKVRTSDRLVQSGRKEELKEELRLKLVECGWRDEMKLHCKEVIRNKGIDQVTVEDLIDEITPKGRERQGWPAEEDNDFQEKEIETSDVKDAKIDASS